MLGEETERWSAEFRHRASPRLVWQHGEPHQGVPVRSLCRPHLGDDHARQPATPMRCLFHSCPDVHATPDQPQRYRAGECDVRNDTAKSVEEWCAGDDEYGATIWMRTAR